MSRLAAVAIGYNRDKSMRRLLASLEAAYYDEPCDLIISIDNAGTDIVEKCASAFEWTHGNKKVVTYPQHQGLRKHILHCGDFVKDYDAIAVLEDDVVVAPGYFVYMREAVNKYQENDRIAGISLYNHLWNVNVNMPFEPEFTPYDTYFMQYAQSWGQIWMKRQWYEFKEWYKLHDEEITPCESIPEFVSGWPKTSWLKYHIKYCIDTDKYFVYPYHALATCYSDVGEHCRTKDTHLQIPMLQGIQHDFRFPNLERIDTAKYDAFFERVLPEAEKNGIRLSDICVDLYGSKVSSQGKRYLLSSKIKGYAVIETYAFEVKPHELNFLQDIHGQDFFLYDTIVLKENHYTKGTNEFRYRFRLYGKTHEMLNCVMEKIVNKVRRKK